MTRRDFSRSMPAALVAAPLIASSSLDKPAEEIEQGGNAPFRMKFGPHAGHFGHHAGEDVLDQIRFAHDNGFTAWEDNGAMRRDPGLQAKMGELLAELGMTMGVFVAYADFKRPTFSGHRIDTHQRNRKPEDVKEMLVDRMRQAVEVARRLGAEWATVVPGAIDPSVPPEYQAANAVEMLKYCAEICEPANLTLVLEPLNFEDHPGCFLQRIPQAHQVCQRVGSPAVKILDDLYHQQITEGNLITNMEKAWDEIAYIQVGDVPGRKEPTSGEINYKNVFQWLSDKGYRGVVGMEHGISQGGIEGERKLIASYRSVDPS